jgi:hypothetical protein
MIFATKSLIALHFWWPNMKANIAWFIHTCHLCQLQQTYNLLIPPTVTTPTPLFTKVYINMMHMPASGGYCYIVQGQCSLTYYPEFRKLCLESAMTLGNCIFKDIICCWGSLSEIVTDNGPAFVTAMEYLTKQYHIRHIHISRYNSCPNGLIERAHFNVQQSLFKAVDGDQAKWSIGVHSVFWAERVTVHKHMGCSPYVMITGSHPLIPLDISEATYLQPPPDSILSSTDLISQ